MRRYHYRPPPANHPLLLSAPKAYYIRGTIPETVDLRSLCLPIRDQGDEGACSGFATAAFNEVRLLAVNYHSPAYLYARTRMVEGTFPQDAGASIADEFATLQNYGVCAEADLPYNQNPSEAPTPQDDVQALPNRLIQPWQVPIDPTHIKSVLAGGQVITIGFTVYQSFENTGSDGVVPMPDTNSEQVMGGHGVCVVGYDDARRVWIVRNQWNVTWGDKGYCYMPYGYEKHWVEAWTGPV